MHYKDTFVRVCLDDRLVYGCVIENDVKDCDKCSGGVSNDSYDMCAMKQMYYQEKLEETTGICRQCLQRRTELKRGG